VATITVRPDRVHVRPSAFERATGLLCDLDIPRDAVVSAEAVPDGLSAAKGWRAPGLAIPGLVKTGTWHSRGRRAYVIARRRPALVLRMTGFRYDLGVLDHPQGDLSELVQELSKTD
jgi:hypothetical protein